MLAGKDVYLEKPMTLTIEEGRKICDICRRTGRIVQIGTQQRSDEPFIRAIALIRAGRLGELKKATCGIGGAPTSPVMPVAEVPTQLDWNLWLGPAPEAPYHFLAGNNNETKAWSRCHYEFRWWYEYSGGKLTDWGAHHVDIATWGLRKTDTGPTEVNPLSVKHPVEFVDGFPVDKTRYNTATEFHITATFDDGKEIEIRHDLDNGILFEGTEGRIFVNRGRLTGQPVEDLAGNPLPASALEEVYKNRPLVDHFRNFFEAVRDSKEPISDVYSHHRALTTCHLAGIAARLGAGSAGIRWQSGSSTMRRRRVLSVESRGQVSKSKWDERRPVTSLQVLRRMVGCERTAPRLTVNIVQASESTWAPLPASCESCAAASISAYRGVTLKLLGIHLLGRHRHANLRSHGNLPHCEHAADRTIDTTHATPPNRAACRCLICATIPSCYRLLSPSEFEHRLVRVSCGPKVRAMSAPGQRSAARGSSPKKPSVEPATSRHTGAGPRPTTAAPLQAPQRSARQEPQCGAALRAAEVCAGQPSRSAAFGSAGASPSRLPLALPICLALPIAPRPPEHSR